MRLGDILEAVTEPEFIIEVIEIEAPRMLKAKETFIGKVIRFPKKSNRWANTQTVGKTGRYLNRDFIPSIVDNRDVKLARLLDADSGANEINDSVL
jgi:hypothetical protein